MVLDSDICLLTPRSKVLITASGGARAKKVVPLKQIADKAVQLAATSGFQVGVQRSSTHSFCLLTLTATPDASPSGGCAGRLSNPKPSPGLQLC